MAHTIRLTRSLDVEPSGVDGRCRATCSCKSGFYILSHFVHANDKDNLLWPPSDSCHTVTVSIDINDDAILDFADDASEPVIYNLNGIRLSKPQKGVNIIRTKDGKVKKVMVTERR